MKILVALIAVAGCTSFDPIQRNTCGNGILEAGEDCDSNDPSCIRCAVACAKAADCPTADYACGVDGFCHAPGGALAQPVMAGTFQVDNFEITDVDRDGIGDALGLSKTSIVVRHGDAAGTLAKVDSLITPQQTGPAALGDLDNDRSLDITLTTPDGLVTYTSPYGVLTPLAVKSLITSSNGGAPLDIRMMFRIADAIVGAFISDGNGHLLLFAVDFNDVTHPVAVAPCLTRNGAIDPNDFSPSDVDLYQVNKDSDATKDVVLAMVTGSAGSPKFCAMAIHKDLLTAPQIVEITPANAAQLAQKPVFADLDADADRCPGLVDNDGGAAGLRYWAGQMVGGHCTLLAVASSTGDPLSAIAAPAGSMAVGHVALDPGIPFAASDALVVGESLYAYAPGGAFYELYHANRKLAGAANGDLDHDGENDAVLYAKGQDDLDVLYRRGLGYEVLRIDTASEVTGVTLGDYDGNTLGDIAYTEQVSGHQRLMVSYSTPDRPLAPIEVGEFDHVGSIARLEFRDSVDILGIAEDLAVIQPGAGGALPSLVIMHGSPQRTMLPYSDPRLTNEAVPLRGAVIGQFAPSGTTEYRDVITFAAPLTTPVSPSERMWRIPGVDKNLDVTPSQPTVIGGVTECGGAAGGALCIDDARYLAWPVTDTKDIVLAVDRASRVATFDPWATGTAAAMPITTLAPPAGAVVHSLHAADLDGDDAPELIATFAPPAGSTSSAVLVCRVSGGVPQSCDDVVPAIVALEPATTACVDAAPGQVAYRDPGITSPTVETELVVVCHDDGSTLYRVTRDAAGFHPEKLAHSSLALTALRIGDVTGDGVADVVALEGDLGSQALVVYRQCSSRDAVSCQRSTSNGTGSGQ